jgi:SET domain-containing protein
MSDQKRHSNVQLRELLYVGDSGIHGRGVFAARRIARGEYIGTFAGPEVRRDGIYVLWVHDGSRGDEPIGRSGRNVLRFLNHSSRCNAVFDAFDLYARRNIRPGEEITIDYGGEDVG